MDILLAIDPLTYVADGFNTNPDLALHVRSTVVTETPDISVTPSADRSYTAVVVIVPVPVPAYVTFMDFAIALAVGLAGE
jgi:hypothetical protein